MNSPDGMMVDSDGGQEDIDGSGGTLIARCPSTSRKNI
jgi:hypothetical protein